MFGGTPAEKLAQYAASSPIADVARVEAPLLIIQGRNDTRTPARPIEVYVERLQALGKTVEVDWFDTGHVGGFADIDLASPIRSGCCASPRIGWMDHCRPRRPRAQDELTQLMLTSDARLS